MLRKTISSAMIALILSACASNKLRQATNAFGNNTAAAVAQQESALAAYYAAKFREAQDFFVRERVALATNPECDAALATNEPTAVVKKCDLVPRKAQSRLVPALTADNVRKLGRSLGGYANALAVLSGDFKGDATALTTALTGIAGSIKTLDGNLAKARGEASGQLNATKVDAITTLVADAAVANFQAQRDRALIKIIRENNPAVQDAVAILSPAADLVRAAAAVVAYRALQNAVADHENALARGERGNKLREVNDAAFARLAEYKAVLETKDPFAEVGKAHAALVKLTNSNFSKRDYEVFIEHLVNLVESAGKVADV